MAIRAPATVRHCRQFRKKYWIGDYGLAVGENFGALFFSSIHSHFHIIVVATIILCSPHICVYPPSPVIFLRTTKSTVGLLPPPLPIETTFQWVGAEKIIFF